MANREQPYDPYIPAGGAEEHGGTAHENPRTAALQAQINDTVNVMKQNIHKGQQRGQGIVELEESSTGLQGKAQDFNARARDARKKMFRQNCKWTFIVIGGIVLLAIIIGVSVYEGRKHSP